MLKNDNSQLTPQKLICDYCFYNPKSHSFKEIKDIIVIGNNTFTPRPGNIKLFYSRPANAELYSNTASVIKHFGVELNGVGEWEWIFGCEDMGVKHYLQFGLVKELCQLLALQCGLRRVYIVNSTWLINITLKCARTILSNFPDIQFI